MNTHVARRAVFTPGGFGRLVEGLGVRLRAAFARHAATSELGAMSERELADMGINRSDVRCVFDPEFAHEYELRRG